jgi:hypothetical protein
MIDKKNEPKDSESQWLNLGKLTTSMIVLGRLVFEIVKLFIER